MSESPTCGCGLPMSRNLHPSAGYPTEEAVEAGYEWECMGFTGTRHGMTEAQIAAIDGLLSYEFSEVHHGDCVGADLDMHKIAKADGQTTVAHPPSDPKLRAYADADVVLEPKPYHDRNRDIVDATSLLLATPAEMAEQERGGTWYTIRYARSQGRPVVIVWPDGSIDNAAVERLRPQVGARENQP